MWMLDEDRGQGVAHLALVLTEDEATELRDSLCDLLASTQSSHAHVPNAAFDKELTVSVHRGGQLGVYSARMQQLVRDDV